MEKNITELSQARAFIAFLREKKSERKKVSGNQDILQSFSIT